MQKVKEELPPNLLEYIYDKDQMVEIPGSLLYSLLNVLQQVQDVETKVAYIQSYPETSKKIFNPEEKTFLESVNIDWKEYPTAQSFFNQTPVTTTSILGSMAMDLLLLIKDGHIQNINAGIAKKIGTVIPREDVKL